MAVLNQQMSLQLHAVDVAVRSADAVSYLQYSLMMRNVAVRICVCSDRPASEGAVATIHVAQSRNNPNCLLAAYTAER